MVDNNSMKQYPIRRIKSEDGMAVTAQVWEEAHEYHNLRQKYHDLLQHSSGIITGLEVSVDERPFTINLKPGLAIDPAGELIIVQEPKSYLIGSNPGLLYLILSYGRSILAKESSDGPRFIRSEFTLQAVGKIPDNSPCIEVARINLSGGAPIRNAIRPDLPGQNELDLRFRPYTLVNPALNLEIARIGVCYTSAKAGAKQPPTGEDGHGAALLARALRSAGKRVWVDDGISLEPQEVRPGMSVGALDAYTLIYLVGESQIQLNEREVGSLRDYVRKGGTLLIEPCRKDQPAANSQIFTALFSLAGSFGTQLAPPVKGHPLLSIPHFFSSPPPGFETEGDPRLQIGAGVIFSACDYGCLWQGERRGRLATREEIRTAEEWGENLLAYAAQRRREVTR